MPVGNYWALKCVNWFIPLKFKKKTLKLPIELLRLVVTQHSEISSRTFFSARLSECNAGMNLTTKLKVSMIE